MPAANNLACPTLGKSPVLRAPVGNTLSGEGGGMADSQNSVVITERLQMVIAALNWLNDPMKLKQVDKELLRKFRDLVSDVRKTAWNVEQWSG